MAKKLTDSVQFDFVRYANVWEDAAVLRQGLRVQPGDRVLSIGSAGDNCFALLLDDPAVVVAADLNPAQLHLVELKMAAMRHLSYGRLLWFLGFEGHPQAEKVDRNAVFIQIQAHLSAEARAFWPHHAEAVSAGVIHAGKFERYFRLFVRRILPLIHSQRRVAALLTEKSADAQVVFYREKWNTWRWRLLFKVFFSRWVMGRLGRDPEFLRQVEVEVGDFIFQRAEQQLSRPSASQNHILRYNLTGDFGPLLPDYLASEADFLTIRARLDRVLVFQGFAQDAGPQHGPFDAMNLSNIFEYMDEKTFAETGRQLRAIARPGTRLGYWNLMVPRRLSHVLPAHFGYDATLSADLTAQDRGFFYQQFIVDLAV